MDPLNRLSNRAEGCEPASGNHSMHSLHRIDNPVGGELHRSSEAHRFSDASGG